LELLENGEALGYPRLGYGRSSKIPHDKRIKSGKDGWESFCAHAHVNRILPALRISRVLRANNVVKYNPPRGEVAVVQGPLTVSSIGDFEDGATIADLLEEVVVAPQPKIPPAIYPPGKRRRYPTKKNKPKVTK